MNTKQTWIDWVRSNQVGSILEWKDTIWEGTYYKCIDSSNFINLKCNCKWIGETRACELISKINTTSGFNIGLFIRHFDLGLFIKTKIFFLFVFFLNCFFSSFSRPVKCRRMSRTSPKLHVTFWDFLNLVKELQLRASFRIENM